MKVFTAIIPLLLSVGTIANPTFRYEDGIVDSRCPLNENPMNPVHLPHARDCGKFLKCFRGRAFTINCPPGQEFGPQIQRCDYPAYAQCRSVLALPDPAEFKFEDGVSDAKCARNDDPMHPLHLPHPTSCQKFMKCFSGMRFELDCPPGQHWAAHLNRCDFPSIAKCVINAKPFQADHINETEDTESVNESSENTDVELEEAVETAINDQPLARPAIAVPMKAEFVYNAGVPDIRCPRTDDPFRPIHLPHATDCGRFQKCFDGRAYILNCPPGQEFGPKLNRCDYPQYAQCSLPKRKNMSKLLSKAVKYDDYYDYYSDEEYLLQSSEWTDEQREMIAGVTDSRCTITDDNEHPMHLTHKKDCGKFYKCYDGRAYLIQCPAGQHWSVRFDRCDYPKVAKCTIRP
ncbi:uncharacterized protein LOC135707776 [Ochlerotatus camptorhynchus]|uniref:uncharacterized protein LOC135707776 n=1 Tax=Ochlerotatus camptorhynchus TaxID=644619 RepID=UPI0031DDC5AB